MGYMSHNAIVVVSWNHEDIVKCHNAAQNIGLQVSELVPGTMNGYKSFLIAPDGSKEGWSESDLGDFHRQKFIDWLVLSDLYCVEWAEIQMPEDDEPRVTRSNETVRYPTVKLERSESTAPPVGTQPKGN